MKSRREFLKQTPLVIVGGTVMAGEFLQGCAAGLMGIQQPTTDVGKANLYDGTFLRLVSDYNTEAAVAESADYVDILQKRRLAIVSAYPTIRNVSLAVYNNQPLTIGMLDAVNAALLNIKLYMYNQRALKVTQGDVEKLLNQAHVYNTQTVKGPRNPWLILIEIVQGLFAAYSQAQHQALLDETQLQAEFQTNHNLVMNFTEAQLVVLGQ